MAICCGLFFSLAPTKLAHAQTETGCTAGAWVEVPGGGITNGAGPAAVEFNDNLYLFVTGQANDVFVNVFHPASGWSGWSVVPGGWMQSSSRLAATVFHDQLWLFAIGSGDIVSFNILGASGWSGWIPAPIQTGTSGLAATTAWNFLFGEEELNLFVRGFGGHIFTSVLRGNSFVTINTEVPGGGLTTHGPAATTLGDLFVYIRGYDGGVYENEKDMLTGNWSGWHQVSGGALATADPGAAGSHGGMMLSIRGGASHIWQNLLPPGPGVWSEVPGNGRAAASAGPAVIVYHGLFLLFVSGPDDHILCSVATAGG